MTVWPGSAWARPRGVPWSKRMSIDGRRVPRWWRRSLEAPRHKVEHRSNLLPRHVELFHHFFDAQIFKVLDHCGNRQPRVPKHSCTADPAGDAFHGGALRPVETRHLFGASSLQGTPRRYAKSSADTTWACDTKVERREKLRESRKILAYPYCRPRGEPRRAKGDALPGHRRSRARRGFVRFVGSGKLPSGSFLSAFIGGQYRAFVFALDREKSTSGRR